MYRIYILFFCINNILLKTCIYIDTYIFNIFCVHILVITGTVWLDYYLTIYLKGYTFFRSKSRNDWWDHYDSIVQSFFSYNDKLLGQSFVDLKFCFIIMKIAIEHLTV